MSSHGNDKQAAELLDSSIVLDLDKQLCFKLYACSRAMTKVYQPMMKDLGITYPQYLVLLVLWEWAESADSEPTVSKLGERLRLDSGTLTPLLKRLEQRSLVIRQRAVEDERRVLVQATESAFALRERALNWVNKLFSGLAINIAEVDALRDNLNRLLMALEGK